MPDHTTYCRTSPKDADIQLWGERGLQNDPKVVWRKLNDNIHPKLVLKKEKPLGNAKGLTNSYVPGMDLFRAFHTHEELETVDTLRPLWQVFTFVE